VRALEAGDEAAVIMASVKAPGGVHGGRVAVLRDRLRSQVRRDVRHLTVLGAAHVALGRLMDDAEELTGQAEAERDDGQGSRSATPMP
jgi:hypothetical protein